MRSDSVTLPKNGPLFYLKAQRSFSPQSHGHTQVHGHERGESLRKFSAEQFACCDFWIALFVDVWKGDKL